MENLVKIPTAKRNVLESRLTQDEAVVKLNFWGHQMSRGTYSYIKCGLDNIRVEEFLVESFGVEADDFFKGISRR